MRVQYIIPGSLVVPFSDPRDGPKSLKESCLVKRCIQTRFINSVAAVQASGGDSVDDRKINPLDGKTGWKNVEKTLYFR